MIRFAPIYEALLALYGPQRWWPAEDAFEIMVGALLVQRTTWQSAATAIAKLQQAGIAQAHSLQLAPIDCIEECITGAGFFRTKAKRLKSLAAFVVEQGGANELAKKKTPDLRVQLLQLEGIGPETADAILLYAFERPVVVIDQYLRRLAERLTGECGRHSDRNLRQWITAESLDVDDLNELHALVVAHGQAVCTRQPRCPDCAIRSLCRTGKAGSDT